jgi:hypothetical protein
MRVTLFRVVGLLIAVAVALPAAAQFGHPLKGSWSGDWGTTKDNRTRVLIDINWDGKALTGAINPGPSGVPLQKATLDPSNWGVHIEAAGKDASGQAVRYVIDGKLENIGASQRFITGTWTEGTKKGDFKIVRN